jgi:DNA-binding MarR family transcriptional regulator
MTQSANAPSPKCQNDTLDCTLEELAIAKLLKENGKVKQEDIALHLGKSLRTVKRIMSAMSEKGMISRENGKRNGIWIVKMDL